MKYSLTVNCRKIGICHKSSKRKIHLTVMIVREYHLDTYWHFMFPIDSPDTIIAEGQSHHEGQSRPPSVRPARHLRALHRHIFVLFVVTPRDHSSFAAPKCIRRIKKEKEKGENGDGKRDWVTGRLTEDPIVIATASSHGHDDSQCRCPLPRPRRSLIPHGNPCPVTKAKKVGIYTCAISRLGERSWRKSPRRVTYISFAFVTDRLRGRSWDFAIISTWPHEQ